MNGINIANVIDEELDTISNIEMINDAVFLDFDTDGDKDLIVVGAWMSIPFYKNGDHKFCLKKREGISGSECLVLYILLRSTKMNVYTS